MPPHPPTPPHTDPPLPHPDKKYLGLELAACGGLGRRRGLDDLEGDAAPRSLLGGRDEPVLPQRFQDLSLLLPGPLVAAQEARALLPRQRQIWSKAAKGWCLDVAAQLDCFILSKQECQLRGRSGYLPNMNGLV